MKNSIVLMAVFSLLLFAVPSKAQVPGVYRLLAGGTTYIPSASTNVVNPASGTTNTYNSPAGATTASNTNLLALNVGEYDYAGLTFGETGTATSTNSVLVYKSFDGGATFETTASFQYNSIAPGAASYITNASLDIHGVTTLAFVLKNTGTTVATNALLEINLKAPRLQAQAAGTGTGPGTPIAVPNFP